MAFIFFHVSNYCTAVDQTIYPQKKLSDALKQFDNDHRILRSNLQNYHEIPYEEAVIIARRASKHVTTYDSWINKPKGKTHG